VAQGADAARPSVNDTRFGGGPLTVSRVQSADPFAMVDAMRGLSMAEVEALDEREAEALVAACERAVTAIQARAALAMETLAGRVQERLDAEDAEFAQSIGLDEARWVGSSHQVVPSMLAPALRVASHTVLARLEADRFLVNTMPAAFAAMWAGDLERHRADAVTECGRGLSGPALERYETLVLEPSVEEGTGQLVPMSAPVRDLSRASLRRRAARIARDLDPDVTREWAARAYAARRVRARGAAGPGMTRWDALLPADVSSKMWGAVDALATSYCRGTTGLAMDAARADALADLVLGNSTITTTIELVVPALPLAAALAMAPSCHGVGGPPAHDPAAPPAARLIPTGATAVGRGLSPGPTGGSSRPGRMSGSSSPGSTTSTGPRAISGNFTSAGAAEPTVPGGGSPHEAEHGIPVTWVIAGMAEDPRVGALLPEAVAAMMADPAVLIRLSRLDSDGSVARGWRRYRPGAALRRRVRSRDRICRFPGCNTPAARTDLDHVIPFPDGPTDDTNLVCLCRTHHLFKHHGGWACMLSLDGTLTWSTQDGRTYRTQPGSHQLVADLLGSGAGNLETTPSAHNGSSSHAISLAQLVVEEAAQTPCPPEAAPPDEALSDLAVACRLPA
jgi:hypothetical protein